MKASLRPALHEKQFSPAYYLYGEDDYLKEEALRKLIDAAVDPSTRDFNLDVRKGSELDAATLDSLLASMPMMAERRVIVVRDVNTLKKDARGALEAYLRAPASDVVVILTAAAEAKVDKFLSEVAVAIDCERLTGAQVPKWIVARVEKHLRMRISGAAVELLQSAVGSDLSELAIELDKLAAYCGEREIDETAVADIVGVRRDETPARLFDAIAMRDRDLALSLIPGVLQQPKMGAVPIVMALTTQTLALALSSARKTPPSRQYGEYFSLLRSASSNPTFRAWGDAASAWSKASARWSEADLDHALSVLLQADLALKNSRVSSDEQILATAVIAMCGGAGHQNAA
jgi:DNA polymerase-3 subunit delta